MKIVNLSEQNSQLNHIIAEIRDINIQHDPLRFRRNIERIGELIGYEISKTFDFSPRSVKTPLGVAEVMTPDDQIVLGTVLRAGLPLHQGFLNLFDRAENAFISAYRKYKDALKFEIHIEYIAAPELTNKTLLLVDPMLATGSSIELSYKALLSHGTPKKIHFASVIASHQALDYLNSVFPNDEITCWVATVDPSLDKHAYIVPGIGDAGDLAYGPKR